MHFRHNFSIDHTHTHTNTPLLNLSLNICMKAQCSVQQHPSKDSGLSRIFTFSCLLFNGELKTISFTFHLYS